MSAVTSYTKPDDTAYTTAQYCKALLPEYKYSTTENEYITLGKDGLKWGFRTNGLYGNVYFALLWYSDGEYSQLLNSIMLRIGHKIYKKKT